MKRDPAALAAREYDLLVVGGGIYGAAVLREAALRGLSAALVEQQDFAAGTSANSLKIIHGGLRYLQQLDLPRIRESVRERRFFLRAAPHLASRLPCLMPTRARLMQSRAAMGAALLANDVLSCDRNRGVDPALRIPRGRLISKAETAALLPGLDAAQITGGAVWYDALAYDTERIVIGLMQSAVDAGAAAANYVRALRPLRQGRRVTGVVARDELTGAEFDLSARLVVHCAGAWSAGLLHDGPPPLSRPAHGLAVLMNIVLDRQLVEHYAVGLSSTQGRLLFFVPWRGRTMIGTYTRWHEGPPESLAIREEDLREFLQLVNEAYPGAAVRREHIAHVQAGLLPADPPPRPGAEPSVARHFEVIDHAKRDGVEGLVTVVGVKYTTARDVAARVVQSVAALLGEGNLPPSNSDTQPLPGGDMPDVGAFFADARKRLPSAIGPAAAEHLLRNYGTAHPAVVALAERDPQLFQPVSASGEVIGAEVVYSVRAEMAQTLADVVLRRTGLATQGPPAPHALEQCAALIGAELDWDAARIRRELKTLSLTPFRVGS